MSEVDARLAIIKPPNISRLPRSIEITGNTVRLLNYVHFYCFMVLQFFMIETFSASKSNNFYPFAGIY